MSVLTPLAFLRRSADVHGDTVAVHDVAGPPLTYAALLDRATRLADALRWSEVAPGDRVAVLAPNGTTMLAAHFAVPGARGVLVALNTRLTADDYAFILGHCGARAVLVAPELRDQLAIAEAADPGLLVVEDGADLQAWLDAAPPGAGLQDPEDEGDLIAINYTSGTTGRPKGVMYTHRGAYLNSLGTAVTFGLTAESTYLWTLPMFHCNGWCFTWSVTAMGATHVCLPRPDPDAVLALIAEHTVTHLCAAPVVLRSIVGHPGAEAARFGWGVRAATGGAPPAPAVIAEAERMGIAVTHLWGMTETYGPALVCEPQAEWSRLPADERAHLMARQGVRTVVAADIRVRSAEDVDVPRDGATLGEIVVSSPTVMAGYFHDGEATAEALRGGWLRTGDLAVWHPDGYIEIRDRAKDLIISGGENISSVEVEHALLEHPDVLEAAVVAAADERWGEVPIAFVTLVPDARATPEDLVAWVKGRLARFKAPREVLVSDLPRTATGKVRKDVLRQRVASSATAQ